MEKVTWETQIPVSDRVHQWVRTIAYLTCPLLPSEKYTIKIIRRDSIYQ